MASDFDRRPPMERRRPASAGDWLGGRPRQSQILYPEPTPADPDAVGSFGSDLRELDDYEEPDDYYVDGNGRSYYYDDTGPAPTAANGRPVLGTESAVGSGPSDDGTELAYDDYFDDDDDDEIIDQTSAVTRNALEWAVVLVGAVLVALLLRASLFQAFYIPSESMEDTLLVDDRVLVNKVSYRLHDIHRGDIVVFVRPDEQQGPIRDLIKRVIALPGETIEARDNVIYINDQRLIEPYLDTDVVTSDFGPTVVPEGEIFVMGDNRTESFDSRGFGSIEEDRVIGRAFVLFWPLNRVGSL
ncbi:MAG: signal peptidase I [Actinomycetota bacterium]